VRPPLRRRFGLRGRLAISIAAIVVVALAVTFVAVYQSTGSELRSQIDRDLQGQADALAVRLAAAPQDPPATAAAARSYLESQTFGASASLLVVTVPGAGTVTNQPELLRPGGEPDESSGATREEEGQAQDLRSAPDGFSDTELADAGEVRILTRRLPGPGPTPRAVIRAGEPLESVERAQSEVSRTFLVVGALTLLAAIAAGFLVAARTAAPLRRMARIAAEVDAGELGHRIEAEGAHDEIRSLAESFDHMLDRLEDAFSRQRGFVSDASHELRTPLTAIRGQLEVLAREPDPSAERVRETERTVRREIERMSRLVDDLLALARIDEGSGLTTETFAIAPLLEELVAVAEPGAGPRIERSAMPGGTVCADPDRIAQVVRNLLANAVEHAGQGGHVRVGARAIGGSIEVTVDDDGPGIPAEERERVFDRFHRADASRSRGSGGSGLGLAIARAIVEAHGGEISTSESPLGGARVAFTLPGYAPGSA
jgi:two-component system OmpR family sensor kinase